MSDTTALVRKLTAHADCDHPVTKTARAACRRARKGAVTLLTRETAAKGQLVTITRPDAEPVIGTLIGWGDKRIVLRDTEGTRVNVTVAEGVTVIAATVEVDNDTDD